MSEKPTYLGLLNAVAVAETRAHCYFTAWIGATKDPEVRAVLETVAAREGEHGMSFAKRVNELGYRVREKDDPRAAEQVAVAGSDLSDLEKMKKLGLDRLEANVLGIFDNVFADHTIDIQTGALLGRYIAEEFDTARLLRCCYEQLKAREAGGGSTAGSLEALTNRVNTLCQAVEQLREVVSAQARPATNGYTNGKTSTRTRAANR